MGWPRLLLFVRHAESIGNVLDVDSRANFRESTHSYGLTPRGIEQAKITGEYIKQQFGLFDNYFVSYYQRTIDTMALIDPYAEPFVDARLAEAQRGIYHSMTKEQIAQKFPEELERKQREDLYHYRPFGGENWADVELRIYSFMDSLKNECDMQKVLIVGHGHWHLLFRRLLYKFSIKEALKTYKEKKPVFKNAGLTHYYRSGNGMASFEELAPWEGKLQSEL